MLELGKIQKLKIVKKVRFGVYLAEEGREEEKVLLPAKQVPGQAEVGDEAEVFLFRDSEDRLIATVNRPYLTLGQPAVLTCKDAGEIGAFLDMGLERDLLLPYREMTHPVKTGDRCLVVMYIDKSGRLAATEKVYEYLQTDSPYRKDDEVEGTLYEISEEFGAFVAVDDRYSALIPKREWTDEYPCGSRIKARVADVKPDGKLTLSIRKKAYLQLEDDAKELLKLMEKDGFLPFTDKADPDLIRRECRMSKNAFKRAVGHLLKENVVRITEERIEKI